MKYFFDTEFIEGFHTPFFGKKRHFIDLISIGIVAEDGRTYYAISNEFNPDDANDWVKENVLYPIMLEHGYSKNLSNLHGCLSYSKSAIKRIQKDIGKSNSQIAEDICNFVNHGLENYVYKRTKADCWAERFYKEEFAYQRTHNTFTPEQFFKSGDNGIEKNMFLFYNQPEFYAYYADYDWVVFCSLFGRMIDLPNGFPMYCHDLKQMIDEMLMFQENKYENENRLESWLKTVKNHPLYPKQENEHNALDDAKWDKELYSFIQFIKSNGINTHNKIENPLQIKNNNQ